MSKTINRLLCIVTYDIKYNIIGSYCEDKKLYDNSISNALERKSKRNDQYNRWKKNGKIGFKVSKTNKKFNLTINQPKSRKQRRYI